MTKRKSVFKFTALAMVLFGSVSALAADGKSYGGLVCVPDQSRVPAGRSNGTARVFDGTMSNLSATEALFVTCPFVHDQSNISSGKMYAFDRTTSAEVSCQLRSEIDNEAGRTIFTSATVGSGIGFANGNATPVNYGAVSAGEYNYASCVIPKTSPDGQVSHIAGFNITES